MPTSIYYVMASEPQPGSIDGDAANTVSSSGPCEDCGGRGWYWAPVSASEVERERCDRCRGTGRV